MAYETCPDCGSRQYNGRCSWCHEETVIFQDQIMVDGPDMELSPDFRSKLIEQEKDIEKRRKMLREEAEARREWRESL